MRAAVPSPLVLTTKGNSMLFISTVQGSTHHSIDVIVLLKGLVGRSFDALKREKKYRKNENSNHTNWLTF